MDTPFCHLVPLANLTISLTSYLLIWSTHHSPGHKHVFPQLFQQPPVGSPAFTPEPITDHPTCKSDMFPSLHPHQAKPLSVSHFSQEENQNPHCSLPGPLPRVDTTFLPLLLLAQVYTRFPPTVGPLTARHPPPINLYSAFSCKFHLFMGRLSQCPPLELFTPTTPQLSVRGPVRSPRVGTVSLLWSPWNQAQSLAHTGAH